MFESALRESNPPRQVGSLEPLPLGQGHMSLSGRRESRTLKAYRSTAFEAAAVANRLALPFSIAPVEGIEPSLISLTGSCLTVRPHRITSVRTAGFEPAISCFRNTRDARLPPRPDFKSAQRESNPHFRHGKAVGCRYIMGACRKFRLSKIESTGRESNPRRRVTKAVSCR